MNKEITELRKEAIAQGWTVERTGGSHFRFLPPDKQFSPYIASSTPGSSRSIRNLRAALRQRGFIDRRQSK